MNKERARENLTDNSKENLEDYFGEIKQENCVG